jgi:light-regulated signal transduction histidine kinase (bacteriophytochrome)
VVSLRNSRLIGVNSGELAVVVLVFRDVTERRADERERQAQGLKLRRVNEELNQFAYAVTHDLREPLRNVVNFSELLVRGLQHGAQEDTQTSIKYIVEGVQRMEMLLNDLLAYSHAGGSEASRALVNTNEALKQAPDNLRSAIAETGALLTSDYLPSVLGHEAQLVQVLQNLISNAMKYRSNAVPRAQIRAQKYEQEWIFSVRDNGVGIRPEYQGTVFRLFKRLHGREMPGTGMSFHLMPIYICPVLIKSISPALKKRMQGKTCFNFKTEPEPELIDALTRLTEAGRRNPVLPGVGAKHLRCPWASS